MSKKNNSKNFKSKSEKTSKKINVKKKANSKKVIEEELSNESFDDNFFEGEIEEKNVIEREIKGNKEIKENLITREDLDKTINKNINDKTKDTPGKINMIVKKSRKDTIIDSIIDAYTQLDIPKNQIQTYAQLKTEKINILEKKLADLTEKIVGKVISKTESPMSDDLAVDALFNCNLIMANFIENLVETGRQNEMTKKYLPDMKGFTKKLITPEKEKQLKMCLAEIIREHGAVIKTYMSPICIWAMHMVTTATETITENMSKNSEKAIDT